MDINTNEKVVISLQNIAFNKIRSGERKYDYINEVCQNGSHQYGRSNNTKKYIYCRGMNSPPDSISNCNCVFGCCGNFRNMTIP